MKQLSKREISILFITLALVMIFIVVQVVIKPLLDGKDDAEGRVRLKQGQILKAKAVIASEKQVNARYARLAGIVGEAGADGGEFSNLLSTLESAASDADIHIMNTQPQAVRNQKSVKFYPIEIQISGQWPAIVKFLHLLQSQPNYYFIDELNIEKNADVSATISGRILISRMRLK